MVRILTPIPKSIWASLRAVLSGPVLSVLWRVLVIVVGVGFLVAMLLASSSVFIAFLVTTILGVVFSDNLRRLALDVYYGRFLGITV